MFKYFKKTINFYKSNNNNNNNNNTLFWDDIYIYIYIYIIWGNKYVLMNKLRIRRIRRIFYKITNNK